MQAETSRKNAKALIQTAVLELLDERELRRITVADIVRRAGVNRKSYYNHYYDQVEVVEDIVREFLDGLTAAWERYEGERDDSEGVIVEPLRHIRDNRELLGVLMRSDAERVLYRLYREYFIMQLGKWVREYVPSVADDEYLLAYHFAGCYEMIRTWVLEGCVRDELEIAAVFGRALRAETRG